jgi:hypothetical protein
MKNASTSSGMKDSDLYRIAWHILNSDEATPSEKLALARGSRCVFDSTKCFCVRTNPRLRGGSRRVRRVTLRAKEHMITFQEWIKSLTCGLDQRDYHKHPSQLDPRKSAWFKIKDGLHYSVEIGVVESPNSGLVAAYNVHYNCSDSTQTSRHHSNDKNFDPEATAASVLAWVDKQEKMTPE